MKGATKKDNFKKNIYTRSEIKRLRRWRVMNVRTDEDFTSLLYIALTSCVFLYKLPIREGGA